MRNSVVLGLLALPRSIPTCARRRRSWGVRPFLGRPGAVNYGQALAMSTLLMLVCTLGFLAIERFRVGEVGEF